MDNNCEEKLGNTHTVKFSKNGNVIIQSSSYGKCKLLLKPKVAGLLLAWMYDNMTNNEGWLKLQKEYN